MEVITAMGRSDVVMKWELIKRPIMLGILAITAFISPLAIAIGQTIYAICVCFFNAYPNKKIIGYPIKDQIKDLSINFLSSLFMAAVVYLIGRIPMNIYLCLSLQVFAGLSVYYALSLAFRNDSYFFLKNFVQQRITHRHEEL